MKRSTNGRTNTLHFDVNVGLLYLQDKQKIWAERDTDELKNGAFGRLGGLTDGPQMLLLKGHLVPFRFSASAQEEICAVYTTLGARA